MIQSRRFALSSWLWGCLILLSACSPLGAVEEMPTDTIENTILPTDTPPRNRRIVTDIEYNRMASAGENGYPGLIPFDGILPIYDPVFVTANEAPYQDDELVMGVAMGNEAKAYPVSVLHFREMVNDELAGIPILVSW